jgi:adenylate cyclase
MNSRNFFAELKRRNVYKVAVAYAIVSWLLVHIATQVFPFLEIPNWVVRLIVLAIVVEFPIALAMCQPMRNSARSKEVLSVKKTWR